MTVEEYVGLRIRRRREELGIGALEFGSQLGELLGKPWPRQAVSAAELGKRSLGAAEMVAIAHVLATSPASLLTPPVEVDVITMPSGASLPRATLFAEVTATRREDWNLPAIHHALDLLRERAAEVADIPMLVQDLDMLIMQRVAAGGVVRMPLAPDMETGAERGEEAGQRQPIVAAIVTSDRGVLIGKRNDGRPPYTFIAGEVEPGERAEDAAVREVKEETGLEVEAGETIGTRVHPRTGRTMVYMAAQPVRGTDVFVGDRDELAEVRWVSLAEVDDLMGAGNIFEPVREYLARELGEA